MVARRLLAANSDVRGAMTEWRIFRASDHASYITSKEAR